MERVWRLLQHDAGPTGWLERADQVTGVVRRLGVNAARGCESVHKVIAGMRQRLWGSPFRHADAVAGGGRLLSRNGLGLG